MKRFFCLCLVIALLAVPVGAQPIKWVDFQIPYESLKYAMDVDMKTFDQEKHIRWVDVLALAGCRTGGKCGLAAVKKAVKDLQGNDSPEKLLGVLAHSAGLIDRQESLSARELAAEFSWSKLRGDSIYLDATAFVKNT